MQPHRKRSSVWSVDSTSSNNSASTSTSATSAATTSGLLAITCPDILEDEDGEDERPPVLSISDEQVDEHPFDPSIPDEMYWRMMQHAASSAPASPVSSSFHDRVSRLFAAHMPHRAGALPTATVSPPAQEPHRASSSWLSKLRARRESHNTEGPDPASPEAPEEGTVLSCTKRPRKSLRLVSLDQAQQREDIIHRPEGFELTEHKGGSVDSH